MEEFEKQEPIAPQENVACGNVPEGEGLTPAPTETQPALRTQGVAPVKAEQKKKKQTRKGKKKWIRVVIILIILAGVGLFVQRKLSASKTADTVSYTEEKVAYRDISEALTGSGTLEPANSYTVTSLVSGEVLSDTFEEGDLVEKGDLLYTIDSSDAETSETSADLSYKQALEAKYPTATQSGTINEVYVKNGEQISSGTAICQIISNDDLYIDFLFYESNASGFYVGEAASVYISSFDGTVSGKITAVSDSYMVSSTGMKLRTVRVEATNPGLVTTDYTAQAVIGGCSNYGNASITLGSTSTVYASGSGIVRNFDKLAGDKVSSGDRICMISSDSIDNQITNAKLSLNSSEDKLDNYKITAPISGTVITKNVKAGDKLDSTSSSSTGMAVIYDLTSLKMDLAVDELDISKVKVGQTVSITADAVDGTFTGYVDKISIAGTTSNGVTTYPVTIVIEDYGDLLPGMNVNAEIVLEENDNALSVSAAAINRGNTVLVTSDSPSAANALDQTAPDGYVYVQVETGISNDDYIEVTSGLQEGDTVAYMQETASSDSSDMTNGTTMDDRGNMGDGGDMNGGPSGGGDMGGGPSGGGQGGPQG